MRLCGSQALRRQAEASVTPLPGSQMISVRLDGSPLAPMRSAPTPRPSLRCRTGFFLPGYCPSLLRGCRRGGRERWFPEGVRLPSLTRFQVLRSSQRSGDAGATRLEALCASADGAWLYLVFSERPVRRDERTVSGLEGGRAYRRPPAEWRYPSSSRQVSAWMRAAGSVSDLKICEFGRVWAFDGWSCWSASRFDKALSGLPGRATQSAACFQRDYPETSGYEADAPVAQRILISSDTTLESRRRDRLLAPHFFPPLPVSSAESRAEPRSTASVRGRSALRPAGSRHEKVFGFDAVRA